MRWTAILTLLLVLGGSAGRVLAAPGPASLRGTLRDSKGKAVIAAAIELRSAGKDVSPQTPLRTETDPNGRFEFAQLSPGRYTAFVRLAGQAAAAMAPLTIEPGDHEVVFTLGAGDRGLDLQVREAGAPSPAAGAQATGGENVASQQVSSLPLEQRDSSKLLLLAAGTTTTTGTGGNFTQQYSIHGQKGETAVFALDGADTSDSELGGATISDFNVDAIQKIESFSGVMPASIGEGAAGYTNIISKSGTSQFHGDMYEFLRNSVFDARNYFDRSSQAHPGRIPPFVRNEFGLTNGGPVLLPGYNGRDRTFYFVEYQGLRQVQGTTQVLSVPTAGERNGQDTTAFPGDTLSVPVDPQIQQVLNLYPLPNNPGGTFGARTYATNSTVRTTSDQFSIRIDHRLSDKAQLMGRVTWENIVGPTTNPNQTAINPTYAQLFTEGYRSVVLHYARVPAPTLTLVSTIGVIRSTPQYTSINQTQPGLTFSNNLFEPINSQAGGVRGTWGNLLQLRQTASKIHGSHTFEMGVEVRLNRDSVALAMGVNGTYTFGGGPAYSPVTILSASGKHNINPGDLLPDALTAFLTATPSSYNRTVGGRGFPQDTHIGEAGVHREAYNFYFLDNWRAAPSLLVNYGLRYEVNSRMREPHDMTQGPLFFAPDGKKLNYPIPGATQEWVVNPDPGWDMAWKGFGPRLSLSWQAWRKTLLRAAAGITTNLPFPFPDTGNMNHFPFAVTPSASATLGAPIPFSNSVSPLLPPPVYTPQGAPVYPGNSTMVRPNTPIDILRFEQELAALLPGNQIQPLQGMGQAQNFGHGYLSTYTMGIQQELWGMNISASYIGLQGVRLPGQSFPNNYTGASPGFAPFTLFNAAGQVIGGFSQETLFDSSVHSTYNAGELVIRRLPTEWGVGFNISYTFSKAIDNATGGAGGGGSSGPVRQSRAQNPQNLMLEKGPSSLTVPQILSFNVSVKLPFDRWVESGLLHKLASGWQIQGIGQLNSGSPFSVLSGVQQTGYGAGGGDRPDQIGTPELSTSRAVREDYFGRGAANASFFYIPINLPNGIGPYHGRVGTLGKNTFLGPPMHNLDIALWKDIEIAKRAKLEYRAECYNVFNFVNFGLPNNILTGSGFGIINSTASNSRQLQFSLKLMY